jgi:hypothetical protein
MTKISKQDQVIIQKKIDGTLSAGEEGQFKVLIETSPEARNFYRKMAILHRTMEFNSSQVPEIDYSEEIMQKVWAKEITRRPLTGKIHLFTSVSHRQFLSYAAILVIGIIFGSLATYIGTAHFSVPDANEISGTIAKPGGNGYSWNKAGTGITVQNYENGNFRMLLIDVKTNDTIFCHIQDEQKTVTSGNIKLLFSDGLFQTAKQDEKELSYQCSGQCVFLVNNVGPFERGRIRFTRNNHLIYEFKTNR